MGFNTLASISAAQAVLAAAMSEDDLLASVIDLAHALGWLCHHTRPAWTAKGYRTPVQGDNGFVDLVLSSWRRVIFAEVKSEKGKLSEDQESWLAALGDAANEQLGVYVWRPSDWFDGTIEAVLR